MPKVIVDSDIYIDFLRTGSFSDNIKGIYSFRRKDVLFSSVVCAELLHGVLDAKGCKLVEDLYTPFEKARRILTPTHGDWLEAGGVLSKIRKKHKAYASKTPGLINDTLIAMSARRIGGVVFTSNRKDFELIASVRNFQFQVV